MKRVVEKLYKGNIDLYNYNVKQCIENDEDYKVMYNSQMMTLTPRDLKDKCVSVTPVNGSRTGRSYELYGYKWNPDKMEL